MYIRLMFVFLHGSGVVHHRVVKQGIAEDEKVGLCLGLSLGLCLSICLLVYLSVYVCVCLYVCMYVYLYISISLYRSYRR